MSDQNAYQPYVPADKTLPEITARAIILGILLSMILAAANAYLGLFAGITVSASIPAAVISMAVLKILGRTNVLENNIVQTAASAGESLAAGVIFTIPGLILLNAWTSFDYWQTTMIAGFGGVLGVLFTIPLRRALIVEGNLRFPEGVATAEVLKVGDTGGSSVKYLAWAGAIGGLFKLGGSGMTLWGDVLEKARYAGGSIAYVGTNLSPALVGVGYIVGFNIAVLMFIGGAINWWIAIPIIAAGSDPGTVDALANAQGIWSAQTRYLGVGAMVLGGLWVLFSLRSNLVKGVTSGIEAYKSLKSGKVGDRLERDTPMHWVGIALAVAVIPLLLMFSFFTDSIGIGALMAVIMICAGFLFSAVAGYMAGLVGSSNNPISGVTIATILTASLLLVVLMGTGSLTGPAAAIFIGATVACGAAIAGDNMQDLKAGRVLGATPYKQQIMQMIGVVAAAFVMAPVLTLLLEAYGIGPATAANPDSLAAPQASLMAAVAGGVFNQNLPWDMVIIGMGLAALFIIVDEVQKARGSSFRTPVLAVAIGIYLPFELSAAIFLGGVIAWMAARFQKQREAAADPTRTDAVKAAGEQGGQNGLLFAAGLITGEALLGILLAIPIVVSGRGDVLSFWGDHSGMVLPGVILLGLVMVGIYRVATGETRSQT